MPRPPVSVLSWLVRAVAALAAATTLAVAGCVGSTDATAPQTGPQTSRVALAASVGPVAPMSGSAVTVRVAIAYLRAAGDSVPLGVQTFALTDAPTQQIPVTVDIAGCLTDVRRRGADVGSGANGVCVLRLDVALLQGTTVLDQEAVVPIVARPGQTTTADGQVALYTVARVAIIPPTGTPTGGPVRALIGQPITLSATAIDASDQPVTSRVPVWTSDDPTVATIDSASGVLTPRARGRATITAVVGGRAATIVVIVVPAPVGVSVTAAGGLGSGTVTSRPAGIDCQVTSGTASGSCSMTFDADVAVTLVATPATGSAFASWGGDCATAGVVLTCQVTPSVPRSATVTFVAFRTLSVALAGSGDGTVTSQPVGIACQLTAEPNGTTSGGTTTGTCTGAYLDGTAITLTASPSATSSFAGWTGACATASLTCTVTVDQAQRVTATFVRRQATLTLTVGGAGAGTLTATGGGVLGNGACVLTAGVGSTTCAIAVQVGSTVTVTPTAGSASTFGGWVGACAGTTGATCSLNVTADARAGAVFTLLPVPLAVGPAVGNTGAGTVASADNAIACAIDGATTSGRCAATIAFGGTVTLTESPAEGQHFLGWGGACASAGTATSCRVDLRASTGVTARFGPSNALLTILAAPSSTGAGSVVSADTRLSCQINGPATRGNCTGAYVLPATITLRATSDAFSQFVGWSGAVCQEGNTSLTCTLNLCVPSSTACTIGRGPAAGSISANFRADPGVVVTPTASGMGSGTLTVTSPINFRCTLAPQGVPSACQFTVRQGAQVTLTVTPDVNTVGVTYGGACAGQTRASCTFTAAAGNVPSVTYSPRVYTVSVAAGVANRGAGGVTAQPGTIACAIAPDNSTRGVCAGGYAAGSLVTLTATPAANDSFVGWGAACASAGANRTCVLPHLGTMTAVQASFAPTPYPLTLVPSSDGTGSGTLSAPAAPGGVALNCVYRPPNSPRPSGSCAQNYPRGSTVTVTRTPDSGSGIREWTGACAATSRTASTCTVTMNQAQTVGAVFSGPYTIGVSAPGTVNPPTGGGTVTGTGSVSCTYTVGGTGGRCVATYGFNSSVTYTSSPDASSYFAGWEAPATYCVGVTAFGCTFTANGPGDAVARFSHAAMFELDAGNPNPTVGTYGTVLVRTAGRPDTAFTAQHFNAQNPRFGYGNTVTLTARPTNASVFTGWQGDCQAFGRNPVCTLPNYRPVPGSNAPTSGIVQASFGGGG